MKKIAKYFLAALAMTTAVSCAKELTEEFKPANKVQGKSYVFSAYMDDADTKTVIDGNTMQNLWMGDENGNEYITIMEPGSVNTYVAKDIFEPTAEATFSMAENGGNGLTGKSVFAVYPAGAWSCFNTADSLGVTVTYPNLQYAYAGSYDPQGAVAVAYNPDVEADQHLAFKNTTALLKFQIQATSDPVFNVTVYSLAGEPIAGTMILKQKGEKGSVTAGEDAKSWVEISDKDLMPLDAETDYYIAVAPALLKGGIGVQLNKDEVQTFTISKEINIERNKIYDLGAFSYDAPADDVWYLIGDFNAGNANSIAKTQLEVVGNHYVAKNVTIADGQAFKFYSPTTGKAFYAETGKTQAGAVIPVATDTWNVLTAGNNYSYVAAGTYDIYADKDFAGVAVVKAGAQVPAYPVPTGQFTWLFDDYGEAYEKVFDLGYTNEGTLYVAHNYDQVVTNPETGEAYDWADWRLFGLWEIQEAYDGYEIVPANATSGEIRVVATINHMIWGPMTQYTIYYYSNYNGKAIDIYSPATIEDEEGNPVPVLDEAGNPVLDSEGFECYWSGTGLCKFDENWNTIPVHMELSAEKLPLAETPAELPVPEGQFVWNYDDEVEYGGVAYHKVFDLGYTEPGNLLIGENYDEMMAAYGVSDPTMAGYWNIAERYESYELVPMTPSSGEIRVKATMNHPMMGPMTQYILFYYSGFDGKSLSIYSPAQMEDEEGNPIPVIDENYEPVLNEDGDPCYYSGTGLCELDENYKAYPVAMELSEDVLPFGIAYPTAAQYTWLCTDEVEYGGPAYTKVLDLGFTSEGTIFIGQNYDESVTDPETGDIASFADPRMLGTWELKETYDGYEIIPTDSSSGEIRVKATINHMIWGPMTQYFLIKYSDYYYGGGIALYSPSQWEDEDGNPIPVLDADGEPVYDDNGDPCYYAGIGICTFDEEYNTYPVYLMCSEDEIALTETPKTPEGAQWIIEDTAVAEYFLGTATRTLINLGATDFSALGGPSFAGNFIHLAYSQEDVYGEQAAGMWQAIPTNFLTYATPYEITMAEDGVTGVISIEAYDQLTGDPKTIEIMFYYFGSMCIFDFSALGLEGEFEAFMANPFVQIQP